MFDRIAFSVSALFIVLIAARVDSWARNGPSSRATPPPTADHHVHLLSTRTGSFLGREPPRAADLISALDSAGVSKGAVLSTAYITAMDQGQPVADEREAVQSENDWVLQQTAPYRDRLIPLCGVNPLRAYAVQEIVRCSTIGMKGVKLHFTNSNVDLRNADHAARLKEVFAAANAARLPIVAHVRTWARDYGATDVSNLIREVLPAAPDIAVQIAHMGGWGGYDRPTDNALEAFAEAIATGQLRRDNVYFDLSGILLPPDADTASTGTVLRMLADGQRSFPGWRIQLVARIRQLGPDRVLFATDWPMVSPREYQKQLRDGLGLTPTEVRDIFDNIAPYLGSNPSMHLSGGP